MERLAKEAAETERQAAAAETARLVEGRLEQEAPEAARSAAKAEAARLVEESLAKEAWKWSALQWRSPRQSARQLKQ